MLKILIGLDVEFMAYHKHRAVYPMLDRKEFKLYGVGCDEFGHCIEIRPRESDTAEGLVLNTMEAMSKLPDTVKYMHENVHTMDKKTFIKLLRAQGTTKIIPDCKNIYGEDILNDCKMDIAARKENNRIVFCGMHVHISATDIRQQSITIKGNRKDVKIHTPIELPVHTLVYLFDEFLFKPLSKDKNFDVGRYRSPGFYAMKSSNHFEYRSLGSSAFHPRRLALIFEIIKEIITKLDFYVLWNMQRRNKDSTKHTKEMAELVEALTRIKDSSVELKKLWVPWL